MNLMNNNNILYQIFIIIVLFFRISTDVIMVSNKTTRQVSVIFENSIWLVFVLATGLLILSCVLNIYLNLYTYK